MPLNLLLIQRDPVQARNTMAALAGAGDESPKVERLVSCGEALVRLAEVNNMERSNNKAFAVILFDISGEKSNSIDGFSQLHAAVPRVPILILCADIEEPVAKLAVRLGAQDYILKSRIDDYVLTKVVGCMVDRMTVVESMLAENSRAQVVLSSIGDAVLSTDAQGCVGYLNAVAEDLTGWSLEDALGKPFEQVMRIIDANTREPSASPVARVIAEDRVISLTPNCALMRRDGTEIAIEDSIAPIHDASGQVTGAVMVFHDVSEARLHALRMSYLAQHDSLTGLANRTLFNDRLDRAIAMANRNNQKLALMIMDVDCFKNINDSRGHAVGDLVLQSVAQRLQDCVRSSDTIGRLGGDEFVILLSEVAQAQEASICADKILLALKAPHAINGQQLQLTASIGIVTYPDDGVDAQTLMKGADVAMYHAKDNGRNNYQFFRPEMNVCAVERRAVEIALWEAASRHEFVLHYQPILDLKSGSTLGVEALIRWNHPQRGLLLPAQFISIAEQTGSIVEIGQWALREACTQAQAWQLACIPFICMSVNISAVELHTHGFVDSVRAILKETGLAPHFLELEIAETTLQRQVQGAAAVLQKLRDIGVRIALDDFGTGYSSLSSLKNIPIDTLKIDQVLVKELSADTSNGATIQALIRMGGGLNVRVVAEGVETPEQIARLRRHGCSEAQGHYFGRSLGGGEIAAMLVRGWCNMAFSER